MTTVAGDLLEEGQMVDVMISYHPGDIESVQKLADALRGDGLRVWYADPNVNDEDTSVKGQMVSSSKVFVLMLSENSAQDAQCKDELALAYITNSTIFPVGLQRFRELTPHVDCGMKLMLAKINWTFFVKDEDFEKNYPGLLSGIQEGVQTCADKNFDFDEENPFKFLNSITHVSLEDQSDIEDFWVRHFNDKDEVPWAEFKNQFLKDYGDVIMSTYSEENLNEKFFVNLIYKDIFGSKRNVKWTLYDRFCDGNQTNRPNYFYERLEEYARGLYAMKEVFNMESTLRLTAVQNLGKFSTPSVVSRLLEMLTDADPNIRAVSAIALARAQAKTKKTIAELLKALEDEDRLVRESACFALGFLQSDKAVQAIADKWRNDPISHVRNAAAEALKMMESAEAQKCVHMTEVLTDEMKSLRAEEGH